MGFTMRTARLSLPVMAAALLCACSNGQGGVDNTGTGLVLGSIAGGVIGNQFGKGSGNVAATVAGAVVGGIVGSQIGKSLDERDRRLAEEAEYDALERGQSGSPRQWRDPETGHYGEIVPSKPYKRGVADCRDYTHTVYIDGRPQKVHGTACRSSDGTWQSVG
ncbi:RT0821/Lpp0805 family surface protein [Hyphomicrobium sp.]|uniref:RT0821/Lpp0805 family surface protein n=1 Tax=Hyphomicrobium sp. TaxID=82 RepID=UPI002D77594B|nr:RT0821/Lpp0805 family surface protein [Hyphomicrobium sp.]HET6390805.1 RT0821/Lpp0805 family surface protein [Hyphomicrobium sp.]